MDRVLSFIVDLRRSPSLFFTPLVPYPARSARHLPHAGKALSVVILFLHVSCIRFDDARKAASSYRSLPHWGRGTASAVDRVLSFILDLRRSPSLFFIPLEPYPARSARHLPHAGKALCREKRHSHIAALCFPQSGQRCIPIVSLFLLEILEREAIGILHDLLHFRLCHLQLFIAEA